MGSVVENDHKFVDIQIFNAMFRKFFDVNIFNFITPLLLDYLIWNILNSVDVDVGDILEKQVLVVGVHLDQAFGSFLQVLKKCASHRLKIGILFENEGNFNLLKFVYITFF